jgi:hypothetical protein
VQAAKGAGKDHLHRVVGLGFAAQKRTANAVEPLNVPTIEQVERGHFAGLAAVYQVDVRVARRSAAKRYFR